MRLLVQRVRHASVTVDDNMIGQISKGFLVFVGVSDTDTHQIADKMLEKLLKLRIFEDSEGKTNLSLQDINGELLIVSQFTLYADCRKGNRPSFTSAGNPQYAQELYEYMIQGAREKGFHTEHGSFGAQMQVFLENDGPFTIWLDSEELKYT